MKTIKWGEVQGCIVLVHGVAAPTDDEWTAYLDFLQVYLRPNPTHPRFLVVTAGGTPSPTQRKRMEALSGRMLYASRVAIVTGSTFARGVVTAFSLVSPGYKAFDPKAIDKAFEFLEQPPSRAETIKRLVESWQSELRG